MVAMIHQPYNLSVSVGSLTGYETDSPSCGTPASGSLVPSPPASPVPVFTTSPQQYHQGYSLPGCHQACCSTGSTPVHVPLIPMDSKASMGANSSMCSISDLPVSPIPTDSESEPERVHSQHVVILVQFKWGRQGEFRHTSPLPLGTHVLVTADRGRDLGMVVLSRAVTSKDSNNRLLQSVVRTARPDEVHKWRTLVAVEEKQAKRVAQAVMKKAGVEMKVMHAEYQFDMKKVTFHFASHDSHPDFRPVLDSLFSLLRCRIWFARYNNVDLDKQNRSILYPGRADEEEESSVSDIELPLPPATKKKSKKPKKNRSNNRSPVNGI